MEIHVSQEEWRVPVTVFHVTGSVDAASYMQLQTKAQEAIAAGTHDLLIDLTDVSYMSSAGLRALNQIYNWLRGDSPQESEAAVKQGVPAGTFHSPHLKLLNPSPRVLEAVKTAGFDMFLEIHHDLKNAVASF